MKKIAILVAAMTALTMGVSAEQLDLWNMSDASGTTFDGLVNSGSLSTSFTTDSTGATDGSGSFVIPGDGGETKTTGAYSSLLLASAGTYTLSMNLAGWDLTDATIGDEIEYLIKDDNGQAPIKLYISKYDATQTRLKLVCGNVGATDKIRNEYYGLTGGATALSVYWNSATGEGGGNIGTNSYSWASGIGFTTVDLKKSVLETAGTWGSATSSVSIDSIGLSVIPEPATLGLVVAMGGGILFIRRRLTM